MAKVRILNNVFESGAIRFAKGAEVELEGAELAAVLRRGQGEEVKEVKEVKTAKPNGKPEKEPAGGAAK